MLVLPSIENQTLRCTSGMMDKMQHGDCLFTLFFGSPTCVLYSTNLNMIKRTQTCNQPATQRCSSQSDI
jgi:hypothetical protein